MKTIALDALSIAKNIQRDAPINYVPPSEGTKPQNQHVLPHAMVSGTRGYIEKVVFQINGSYENGWFDSCAVMMRRLVETLIIECFETYGIDYRIKNSDGEFFHLSDLVSKMLSEPNWNLGRDTKKTLPKLKQLGDRSAHNRRYNAHREDIDKVLADFRLACQELLYLARLK
jgi:hypothetical protein